MYVIYPADEVVSLTYISNSLPRPRQRPTLDVLVGPPPPAPSSAPPSPLAPAPTPSRAASLLKTAPPEPAERAPASPTPSLERSAKPRERTKAKFLKKLGARQEDNDFGKIVRTPAPDEFELPAPLPTPAFSRKNIFDRNFDALFEVASTPQFTANIRVTTPEPDHCTDVSAMHFPSSSQLSLLPPRPYSEPSPSPTYSFRTSTPSTPTPSHRNSEGSNSKPKKVSFFRRKFSWSREESSPRYTMQAQPSMEMVLRELTHPAHNEQLKNQQQVTFKLVKTVSDFTTQLSQIYERHSSELQVLVAAFRKRSSELRKERSSIQNPFDSDAESSPKKKLAKTAAKRQPKKKEPAEPPLSTSESESDAEEPATPQPKKRGRKPAVKRTVPAPRKKKQQPPAPLSSDSESEDDPEPPKRSRKRGILEDSEGDIAPVVAPKLKNLLWRRTASGYTSQRSFNKSGEYYIDFRISFSRDAESKDGFKKSLVTLKSCTDNSSALYKAAEKLITAAKREYKNITPVLYPEAE